MSDAQSCNGVRFWNELCYIADMACVTACVLDPYHVSPEGLDGHYEHKKEHKHIEDSLETLWCLSTKRPSHGTLIS